MKNTFHYAAAYAILTVREEREAMSVAKYQIFLKTVERGSFPAAAREMNFTQSGVSHAVGSLEDPQPRRRYAHGGRPGADALF